MTRARGLCAVASLALATAGCARAPAKAGTSAAELAPLVDHHQHLLSPAGAARANRTLPAVALPEDLARLVEARVRSWNDAAALAPLYTEDAVARTIENPGWISGRSAVAAYLGGRFAAPYRMVPVSLRRGDATAQLGGYLVRGEGSEAKPFGFFLLAVERGADGRWRIAVEAPTFPGPTVEEPEPADQLVALLDEAGIRRAVVLSNAYMFDAPETAIADAGERLRAVRAENDWTADQVARFPDRLVALCSFGPLEEYAVAELERCAASGRFRGLKLHFGTSRVDLGNPAHVAKVRRVLAAANRLRLPVVVHVRNGPAYGAEHARAFLDLLTAAPDVPVTIAHLWGGESFSDEALGAYAEAVAARDPRTRNLFFDVAEIAYAISKTPEAPPKVVARMRQIGMDRMLYGTDGPVAEAQGTPAEGWRRTRTLPLTADELRVLATNVAPYLR